jgi:hypothetical protein
MHENQTLQRDKANEANQFKEQLNQVLIDK